MSEGAAAMGTVIKSGNAASPEVFTEIAEVQNIDGPEEFLEFVEATHHKSTGREYKPTLAGISDIPLTMNFLGDEATQGYSVSGLRKDIRDKTPRNFQIEFTNGDIASFTGYVSRFKAGAPLAGMLSATATLKITGLVEWS